MLNSIDPKIFATTNSIYNGPGSYFQKDQLNKNVRGPKWHKDTR